MKLKSSNRNHSNTSTRYRTYTSSFSDYYASTQTRFAASCAVEILKFFLSTKLYSNHPSLLELGCGSGDAMLPFLSNGFTTLGIDSSSTMLKHAKSKLKKYIQQGQAKFMEANASQFKTKELFGFGLSIGTVLNHLANEEDLLSCFRAVHRSLVPGGYFVFDLFSPDIMPKEASIMLSTTEVYSTNQYFYDSALHKVYQRWSGFLKNKGNSWKPFEQTIILTIFSKDRVKHLLAKAGWNRTYFSSLNDLSSPLSPLDYSKYFDPFSPVFVVANK